MVPLYEADMVPLHEADMVPLHEADMVPLYEAVNLNLPVNTFSEAVIPLRAAGKIGCMDTLRDWLYIIHCTLYMYTMYTIQYMDTLRDYGNKKGICSNLSDGNEMNRKHCNKGSKCGFLNYTKSNLYKNVNFILSCQA